MNIESYNIETFYPQLKGGKILLAVSGGVDSMVLLHLFSLTKLNYSVAHCNYNLRDKESFNDQHLVQDVTDILGVEMHIKNINTIEYQKKNKLSTQMAAREIRYNWFESLKIKYGFSHLATAHHLNDQLETFMINFGRGTGIQGLLGIPESPSLIRPLLNFSKKDIIKYAIKNSIMWNEDSTNKKNDYLRNSIRNKVISEWKNIMPDLEKNFKKTIDNIKSTNNVIDGLTEKFIKNNFKKSTHGINIRIKDLNKLCPNLFFLHLIFKKYGFNHPSEIKKILNSSKGKKIQSKTHIILRDKDYIILKKLDNDNDIKIYKIKLIPQKITNPLNIEISDTPFSDKIKSISVDATLINSTLEIRKPFNGAYFYPTGMVGRKKLSKYFKDEKYTQFDKENQWVLTSKNKVVWIIGKRADRRFMSNKSSSKRMYISTD